MKTLKTAADITALSEQDKDAVFTYEHTENTDAFADTLNTKQ